MSDHEIQSDGAVRSEERQLATTGAALAESAGWPGSPKNDGAGGVVAPAEQNPVAWAQGSADEVEEAGVSLRAAIERNAQSEARLSKVLSELADRRSEEAAALDAVAVHEPDGHNMGYLVQGALAVGLTTMGFWTNISAVGGLGLGEAETKIGAAGLTIGETVCAGLIGQALRNRERRGWYLPTLFAAGGLLMVASAALRFVHFVRDPGTAALGLTPLPAALGVTMVSAALLAITLVLVARHDTEAARLRRSLRRTQSELAHVRERAGRLVAQVNRQRASLRSKLAEMATRVKTAIVRAGGSATHDEILTELADHVGIAHVRKDASLE